MTSPDPATAESRRSALLFGAVGLLATVLLVAPWLPAEWAVWGFAVAAGLLPAALVVGGVGGRRHRHPIVMVAVILGLWLAATLAGLVIARGGPPPGPLMLAVVGLWLLPLVPVGLLFALTFDRLLSDDEGEDPS